MTLPLDPTTAAIVARDRVQHFLVAAIAARQVTRRRLVFKGGTLLRACWHPDYRYSEDLDFDWVTEPEETKEELGIFLRDALKDASQSSGVALDLRDRGGRQAVIWATPTGPSGVISLDLNRRTYEGYAPTTREWYVQQRYPGIDANIPITGYTLEAVMAGKLDCLAEPTRLAPRDFFDVHKLLTSGDVDMASAIEAFLQLRFPDADSRPNLLILHDHLLGPGYEHHEDLVDEWATSACGRG